MLGSDQQCRQNHAHHSTQYTPRKQPRIREAHLLVATSLSTSSGSIARKQPNGSNKTTSTHKASNVAPASTHKHTSICRHTHAPIPSCHGELLHPIPQAHRLCLMRHPARTHASNTHTHTHTHTQCGNKTMFAHAPKRTCLILNFPFTSTTTQTILLRLLLLCSRPRLGASSWLLLPLRFFGGEKWALG